MDTKLRLEILAEQIKLGGDIKPVEVTFSVVDMIAIAKHFLASVISVPCECDPSVRPGVVKIQYEDDPGRDKSRIGWKTPVSREIKL